MSEIKNKIKSAIVQAMKAKEQSRLDVLRLMSSALKQKEVDERKELTDAEVIAILQKQLKQSEESLAQAEKAARADLVSECQYQIQILKGYLPQALSPAELKALVQKSVDGLKAQGQLPEGAKAMGLVMKAVREVAAGRADGGSIQTIVKEVLGL